MSGWIRFVFLILLSITLENYGSIKLNSVRLDLVKMNLKKKLLIFALAFSICMVIYFAFLHLKIREHSNETAAGHGEYLIILGARVKGNVPSLSLQNRIDTAADFMKKNNNSIAIASGGQGPGEEISEAEAIKNGLLEHGISESRILIEDKSTNTVENIGFSKKLIPKHLNSGMLVSNDYHLYRAKSIAKDQGLDLAGLPAKTPAVAVPKSYLREYLAITKYHLQKLLE